MKISFVIPCYNSEKNIHGVLEEIRNAMAERPEVDYEVVLVNDCSKDRTADIIKEIAHEDPHVIAVDLAKNAGQPNALLAGFNHVSGDYIMTSDDDGQTPVGRVFDFLDEINKGYDVVCARYTERKQQSLFRRMGTWVNTKMSDWLIEKPKGTYMASFFMARRYIIDEMIKYKQPYPYIAGLILRTTQNIGNIDMEQRERNSGSSGYSISKLLKLWVNGFTAFSIKPLRISAGIGAVMGAAGAVLAFITGLRKLIVPGCKSGSSPLISVNLTVGGLILLFMGLIGEYIGRIYMCINETPQYVVKETVGYHSEK
ncbi:MAG: glycosyltransferase family 2 protein [Frisingicoccus sp.]|uniref:glycosyltransferase family 2 protein n=1 Tax=Frisingicoccus sp. TaxID=1918627 RepID=UPI002A81F0F2|nr:glycosyltransferase family 2 protein [Frisingicoccus sp.]MDY4833725.1 glycosyltransferase family 2 protein [Frisingicoccus sp.]